MTFVLHLLGAQWPIDLRPFIGVLLQLHIYLLYRVLIERPTFVWTSDKAFRITLYYYWEDITRPAKWYTPSTILGILDPRGSTQQKKRFLAKCHGKAIIYVKHFLNPTNTKDGERWDGQCCPSLFWYLVYWFHVSTDLSLYRLNWIRFEHTKSTQVEFTFHTVYDFWDTPTDAGFRSRILLYLDIHRHRSPKR